MSKEFYIEEAISDKQLNNQSVSLVIPRLSRDKIHNSFYYKINLQTPSLRGDTLLALERILIRDFGTLKKKSINKGHVVGGTEFKCILMKMIELCPPLEQLRVILESQDRRSEFSNKYIVAIILVYLRIQYHFVNDSESLFSDLHNIFKKYIKDYRKLISLDFDIDCLSISSVIQPKIIHIDELADQLCTSSNIWGIPLGVCLWTNLFEDESSSDSDTSDDE